MRNRESQSSTEHQGVQEKKPWAAPVVRDLPPLTGLTLQTPPAPGDGNDVSTGVFKLH